MDKKLINEISRIKNLMNVISEQVEQVVTNYDSVWDYKKDGNKYFAKKKTSDSWIELSGRNLESVKTNVFNDNTTRSQNTASNSIEIPFKNKREGDYFRKWVNDNYPEYAKEINLDLSGSYNNSYINKAWQKYGREYIMNFIKNKTGVDLNTNSGLEIKVSDTLNPKFRSQIDFNNLNTSDTTSNFCTPNDDNCAQFVNDLRDDIDAVGNAWNAYTYDTYLGPTIYSAFKGLDENTKNEVINLWLKIHNSGGGKENGLYNSTVKEIVDKLVPQKGEVKDLQVNDIVGIFYPESSHHEEAFYEGGKAWFKDENGTMVPGNTIQRGDGWGMNTHLGTVAAIKDGVPLIFHNVGGKSLSDPPSNLRIAWVKRKGG